MRRGHTALYQRAPRMLDELAIARGDGRLARLLATWARISVLVIDDLLIRPLTPDPGRRPAQDHRGPGRAARHHHHQPAPGRDVAPGHRRPDHRRRRPGQDPGQRRADRTVRRVHAPRPHRRLRPRTTAGPVMSGDPGPAVPPPPTPSRCRTPSTGNTCSQGVTPRGYRRSRGVRPVDVSRAAGGGPRCRRRRAGSCPQDVRAGPDPWLAVLAGIELRRLGPRQIVQWLAKAGARAGADRLGIAGLIARARAARGQPGPGDDPAGRDTPGTIQVQDHQPHGTLRPERKGGEQPGTRTASVGRYAASETPRTKTPDRVIGFVGMLSQPLN